MNKKNKGFTLIEVLMSMAILSIILIAFSTISISSIKGNSKNDIDIGAMNIAQGEIENIRSQLKQYSGEDPVELESTEGYKIYEGVLAKFPRTNNSGSYNVSIELKKAENNQQTEYENNQPVVYSGLYEIKVSVVPNETKEYFSKKTTELITQIKINKI